MRVGELIGPLEVGPVAHGGHCVARLDGQVVFVRHALPGELVTARVRDVNRRFARADTVEVLTASEHRVRPPCPHAGRCGGCDFQHAAPAFQAELKRRVLAEQLQRLAGIDWDGVVEPAEPVLGSRCRMRFVTTTDGRLGLRAYRSHEVVPLPDGGCPLAEPAMPSAPGMPASPTGASEPLSAAGAREMARSVAQAAPGTASGRPDRAPSHEAELLGVVSREGGRLFPPDTDAVVTQRVGERTFTVAANGFWQAHRAAPEVLTGAVVEGLNPGPGERAFDLYCGVGVFAGSLVDAGCRVWGVEGSRTAIALARTNVPQARFLAGSVEWTLARLPARADLVVLDPPRTGAGRAVMTAIARLRPRAVAYVACDPAALARDLGIARELGLEASSIRGFDLFGMTHHLEAVAILHP